MFRFICIVIFLILYLILTIPVLLVEWILGKFNPHARDISSLRIVQWGFKVILRMSGVKATVIGEENIPDEPVLFIGNHRSYFDILLTYSRCKRPTGYVAKNDDEQIMYVTITDHSLISGDEVEFRGRNRSSAVVTNVITFRKGQATRRTTSYDTYCGEGTDIKLNGVCSAYSNSQGSDRVFTTSGRWTP